MRLHIIHGDKLPDSGKLSAEFNARIEKALKFAKKGDIIIFTGGCTNPLVKHSEAWTGMLAAKAKSSPSFCISRTMRIEEESRTTPENIINVMKMVFGRDEPQEFKEVFVYHRKSAMFKTRILYWRLWKSKAKFHFIGVDDTSTTWVYRLLDRTVMAFLALIDPKEAWVPFIWSFLKKKHRNG